MSRTRELYRAAQLPVFQNRMFPTELLARQCIRGDLVLVQDVDTGLMFNRAFDPTLVSYDANYQNEQGHSAAFRDHLDTVADLVVRHFGKRTLIEVGCGKGLFLERLSQIGFSITGLDPTYEGSNPNILREYFTPATGLRADGLILRHVLEHVPNPVAFLAHLKQANGGTGTIYIEVPCMDWIASNHAWFDLCYEHVNYFRLSDFERMFGALHDSGRIFGGQYLYVIADLASLREPVATDSDAFALPAGFLHSMTRSVERLRSRRDGAPRRTAIWGGASKGVIFSLYMERSGVRIETIIDLNPAKQGKFIAATGLQVQSPQQALAQLRPGDDIFVMNRNYLEEIRNMTAAQFNYISVEHEDL